jgi:hypothetical protein
VTIEIRRAAWMRSRPASRPSTTDELVDGAIRSQSESFSGRASIEAGTSNSTLPTRNLVGGEWLDAVEGEVEGVVQSRHRRHDHGRPGGTEADVDRAVEAPTSAVPEWLLTMYGLEDYTQIKHVMAKIDR